MLPYEFYKLLHVGSLFFFLAGATLSFFHPLNPKWNKILTGITSFLIFVAGMGLMARIGVGHGAAWPLWIKAKVAIWLFMAIGAPVLAKRARNHQVAAYFFMLFLATLAAWFATFKPFE